MHEHIVRVSKRVKMQKKKKKKNESSRRTRELKTSEFSRVRSTSENFYVFNSRDEIYLVFTEKKQIFFLCYTIHGHFPIHKAGGENARVLYKIKRKFTFYR